ncbi:hypothetical protein AB0I00_26825 [Streptomyces sp. NPDC050803]|uniref:hypothetical protein n=1 Tax=unclassified Streptomyces TaxID=2593676 RepID=UPI003442A6BC
MRFLFVHGTGVRRERHDVLFGRISRHLRERFPDAAVDSCFWGEEFGVAPGAGARSIPGSDRTRGIGDDVSATPPPDREAAEWGLLLTDPLCELRVLAHLEGEQGPRFTMPGVRSAGAEVLDRLAKLPEVPDDDRLGALLHETRLHDHYPGALEAVRSSQEADRAAARATSESAAPELAVALARALVAASLAAAGTEAECTGDERDRMVELFTARLGGDARAPGGRAVAALTKLALRVATQPSLINLWRGEVTEDSAPFLGDILRYQARGEALRERLLDSITAAPGPTVLIGHSLGGVALFDLLALSAVQGRPVEPARLLVTVGSQAPYLYELGALGGLAPGESLPETFPRWLNIYDRQDLLAFLARPVFPDDPRVTDHEVSSRQPFMPCHSAYWKLDSVYDRIAQAVTELG